MGEINLEIVVGWMMIRPSVCCKREREWKDGTREVRVQDPMRVAVSVQSLTDDLLVPISS